MCGLLTDKKLTKFDFNSDWYTIGLTNSLCQNDVVRVNDVLLYRYIQVTMPTANLDQTGQRMAACEVTDRNSSEVDRVQQGKAHQTSSFMSALDKDSSQLDMKHILNAWKPDA